MRPRGISSPPTNASTTRSWLSSASSASTVLERGHPLISACITRVSSLRRVASTLLWGPAEARMHKLGSYLLVACASVLVIAQPAFAQQTLNFSLGYFTVRGEDARVEGDVLTENRSLLVYDVSD